MPPLGIVVDMADAGDERRELLPARPGASVGKRRRQNWMVEYARYFAAPRLRPSAPPPPGLCYFSHGEQRHPGTWLPATSPAYLCVSGPRHPSTVPVLTVSIAEVVFEEHFVSILNFSWPQLACVTQCPTRGSRVVFVSFCDYYKQIQKFALRFLKLGDAESFLNCVKECPGSDYVCGDSLASEYIVSNGLHDRSNGASSVEDPASVHRTEAPALCYHMPDDASSIEEPASDHMTEAPALCYQMPGDALSYEDSAPDHRTEAPALCYHEELEQDLPALEPLLATNIDSTYSGFPPRFTEMLTNLSTQNEKETEEPYPLSGPDHTTQEVDTQDTSHDVTGASEQTPAATQNDASKLTCDILARIKTYLADDSFHDMMFKIERVIDELGVDLSL